MTNVHHDKATSSLRYTVSRNLETEEILES